MGTLKPQNNFEAIYNDTYDDTLRYIIFKCHNLDDVNDIIQETYLELFKMLKKTEIINLKPFIIGIAKNKLKKYYGFINKVKNLFISKSIDDEEISNTLRINLNLENKILEKITSEEIWQYLQDKNIIIAKIFYLYYAEDIKIKEIANELNLNESTVKNYLYRTLKELNNLYGKDNN